MNRVLRHLIAIMVLLAVSMAWPVYGQEPTSPSDGWDITFTPYFWAPGVDVKSAISGSTSKIDVSFSDIFDNFDVFGLMGRVEARKGDWGVFFDGLYMDLKGDFKVTSPSPTVNIDATITQTMLDFGLTYKLFKVPLEENTSRMLTFEPLGGVRYMYFKQKIKLSATHPELGPVGTTLGGDEEWVEPFVGASLKYDLTEKLTAGIRADFGGFGIGSASKLTWNLVAGIDWQFKKNMSLKTGYRVLDIDYSRHSGSEKFGLDGKMQGPIIGLTILF